MRFKDFIKEKILTIVLLIFAIITIEILLLIYSFGLILQIYVPIAIFLAYFIGVIIEFYTKKHFYNSTLKILDELEDKYLISEIIKKPSFIEGRILKEVLEETDKSMIENVNKYKYIQEDYKDYIELWIHEIKLPIAASKMIVENNKSTATLSIDEELDKIENYTEQALFYARSNTVEKDYCIKKHNLSEIVNEVIKKNKNILIQEKIKINIHDIDVIVSTDSKWIVFVMNQIIQNSIKYKKENYDSEIQIFAKQNKENTILYIVDNGIGIKEGEVERVFEKSFTGTNGRILGKKSTGIGLYLCKKLCDKLGIGIQLNSIENEKTEVKLIFPKSSFVEMH